MAQAGNGASAQPLLQPLRQEAQVDWQELLQLVEEVRSSGPHLGMDQGRWHQVSILPLPVLGLANHHGGERQLELARHADVPLEPVCLWH